MAFKDSVRSLFSRADGDTGNVEGVTHKTVSLKEAVTDLTVGRWRRYQDDKLAAGVIGEHDSHRYVLRMKPRKTYVFRSDYFVVDGERVGCVLSFTHNDGAEDSFDAFWGVYRLPYHMSTDVTLTLLEQSVVLPKSWVTRHSATADRLAEIDTNAAESGTSRRRVLRSSKRSRDLTVIGMELEQGASYLNIHQRLLVIAPSVAVLDEAVMDIEKSYSEASRIPSVGVQAYMGDQRRELSTLFAPNEVKRGKGIYMTSTEYAGMYSLMGHGVVDPGGLYMGVMSGDVNNSAVMLDVDGFSSHVVIGDPRRYGRLSGSAREDLRPRMSDMLACKIAQGFLMSDKRVVHIVLNGCDVRGLTGEMPNTSTFIDGAKISVNPFEVFGEREDKLHLFTATLEKIAAMVRQLHNDERDWSVMKGSLAQVLTDFYIDNGMWVHNAKDQLSRVRLVGIPHESVPKLSMFMAYLRKEKKKLLASSTQDEQLIQVLNVLIAVFEQMLDGNGDLFDVNSSALVDEVVGVRRVVVDVSGLVKRSPSVMMAQLLNVFSCVCRGLGRGDVVVFHGMDVLSDGVKPYIRSRLDQLARSGVRCVFSYDVLSSGENTVVGKGALEDTDFNGFERASYVLLGGISVSECDQYEEVARRRIPAGLRSLIVDDSARDSEGGALRVFLRRGLENVVFHTDFTLGPAFKKYMSAIQGGQGNAS